MVYSTCLVLIEDLTMRALFVVTVAALALGFSGSAQAQCFGETAAAYGCGVSVAQEGSLTSFGAPGQAILPRYAQQKGSPFDGLFTPRENRDMLRNIVVGNLSGSRSASAAFNRAVNANARPVRKSIDRRVGVYFGGIAYGN